MQDDMQELLEQANEIQVSLSRSYAVPDDISEDELEAGTFLLLSTILPNEIDDSTSAQNSPLSKNSTGMTLHIWTPSRRLLGLTLAFSKSTAWYVLARAAPLRR